MPDSEIWACWRCRIWVEDTQFEEFKINKNMKWIQLNGAEFDEESIINIDKFSRIKKGIRHPEDIGRIRYLIHFLSETDVHTVNFIKEEDRDRAYGFILKHYVDSL